MDDDLEDEFLSNSLEAVQCPSAFFFRNSVMWPNPHDPKRCPWILPFHFQWDEKGRNRLSRFTYTGTAAGTMATEEILITTDPKGSTIHQSGWVGFKPSAKKASNVGADEPGPRGQVALRTGNVGPFHDGGTLKKGGRTFLHVRVGMLFATVPRARDIVRYWTFVAVSRVVKTFHGCILFVERQSDIVFNSSWSATNHIKMKSTCDLCDVRRRGISCPRSATSGWIPMVGLGNCLK